MTKPKKAAAKTSARAKAGPPTERRAGKAAAARKKTAGRRLQAPPPLRPVPLYEFALGGLVGQVRLSDPGLGIELLSACDGKSLPAYSREVLSLRHYFARGENGLLAPREEANCAGSTDGYAVTFDYQQPRNWPVEASVRYELLTQGGLDATFAFHFARPLKAFEAGIETLMPRSQPMVYIHSAGAWLRAIAGPQAQRFYPRNAWAAELMADGRWDALRLAGISLVVETHGYDYPMAVVRDERTGWALSYMALTEECTAIWINGPHRTLGLSLIGADVRAQEEVLCRLRVVLCQADSLDDTLVHYRSFVQQARTRR